MTEFVAEHIRQQLTTEKCLGIVVAARSRFSLTNTNALSSCKNNPKRNRRVRANKGERIGP